MAKIRVVKVEKDPPAPMKMLPPPSGDIVVGPSPEEIYARAAVEGLDEWYSDDMRRMLEHIRGAEWPKTEQTQIQKFLMKQDQTICLACRVERTATGRLFCPRHPEKKEDKPSGITEDHDHPNPAHGPAAQRDGYPGQYL